MCHCVLTNKHMDVLFLRLNSLVPQEEIYIGGSTSLHVPNVPFSASGYAERVCLHWDGCTRMRLAYPECPDPRWRLLPLAWRQFL